MRGGRQKNRFLSVHFLQLQVRSQQVSVSDLALLQQFLDRRLPRAVPIYQVRLIRELNRNPIGFRNPPQARVETLEAGFSGQLNFVFATFNSFRDFSRLDV